MNKNFLSKNTASVDDNEEKKKEDSSSNFEENEQLETAFHSLNIDKESGKNWFQWGG